MSIVELSKSVDAHTLTIVAEYPATTERVWLLWADPRQLERWWGPPSHPATVTDHDFRADGFVRYYMTGPGGERYHGGWRLLRVEPPSRLEFEDYFADDHGAEKADLPLSATEVTLTRIGSDSTRMTLETRYHSLEAMNQALEMGVEEGIQQAMGQIDSLLADSV